MNINKWDNMFFPVGECSDRFFVHVQSARGASRERGGEREGYGKLWLCSRLQRWAGGGRWLPPLLLSWPRECGVCQRHGWMGFQVRLVSSKPPVMTLFGHEFHWYKQVKNIYVYIRVAEFIFLIIQTKMIERKWLISHQWFNCSVI